MVHRKGLEHRRAAHRCARADALLLRAVLARLSDLAAAAAAGHNDHRRAHRAVCRAAGAAGRRAVAAAPPLRACLWFAVSQLLVTVFWVPHQVQYFTCFALGYAGCVWVLAKPRRSDALCLALLVLGAATAFCDLLVTPILTLGLPLVCWLLEPQQRLRAGLPQCGVVVGGSLCWGVGYLLCWASKWVLAGLVTGQNVIADALHQVGVRTAADTWHGMELTWSNIFAFVYNALNERRLLWPLAAALVLLAALFVLSIRGRQPLIRALPLLLCTLMTPAWFIVLRTHSIQHGWFTWRALGLTLFSGMAFLYYSCDIRAVGRRIKR